MSIAQILIKKLFLLYCFELMGQNILEGCKTNCQNDKQFEHDNVKKKSDNYLSNLIGELPLYGQRQSNYLLKSITTITKQNNFLIQIKQLPNQYSEYANYLFTNKKKFQDTVFPPRRSSLSWNNINIEDQWARLSEMTHEIASIYHKNYVGYKTRVFKTLEEVINTNPQVLDQMKVYYLEKVGMAVCIFYLNGTRQEILIDDHMPAQCLKYYSEATKHFFLVEKAFAKALGSYEYIEDFQVAQIFQEITGIPYDKERQEHLKTERSGTTSLSSYNNHVAHKQTHTSFKQALKSSRIYIKQNNSRNSVWALLYRQNFRINSLSLNAEQNLDHLIRIKIDKNTIASLRVSFLNKKFMSMMKRVKYPLCKINLYKQNASGYYLKYFYENAKIVNSIYLGDIFNQMEEGVYVCFLTFYEKWRKVSFVSYSNTQISLKQIQYQQKIQQIKEKIIEKQESFFNQNFG